MTEPPLVIPFLPDVSLGEPLPASPVRVAAWTSSTPSSPARRIAVAGEDNTLWILTSPVAPTHQLAPLTLAIPGTTTPLGALTGYRSGGPSAATLPAKSMRPRAASSASTISCSSRAGKRMFSPTNSTVTLAPAPALSTLAASPAPEPPRSPAERSAVLESLKAHAEDERGGLGLGLAGLTRRGLNVQSKEEIESATSPSGSMSSENSTSTTTPGHARTRTLSRLSGFWKNTPTEEETQAAKKDKIDEIAVENEMAREEAEDAKENEDFEIVKTRARASASTSMTPATAVFPDNDTEAESDSDSLRKTQNLDYPPLRIVLPEPGRGHILQLAVFEEIGQLVALRDVGLLDVISLHELALINHIDLDAAQTGTERRMLPAAWSWRRVHLAAREEGTLLVASGVPWPTPGPSPNGEVSRVVMLSVPTHECVATLELPGVGDVGVSSSGEASFLLHATPTSLMSYHIIFPSSPPLARLATPPKSPKSPRSPSTPSSATTPLLTVSRPSPRTPSGRMESSGLSKFLATRRITSRKVEQPAEAPQPGVDGGVECTRDGGGHWTSIRLHDNGQGVGIANGHIEAFDFDGAKITLRGTVSVDGKAKDVAFTTGWHDMCIVTDKTHILAREGGLKPSGMRWAERKTFNACAVSIVSGSMYTAEPRALVNVDLGTLERRVEATLQPPVAGEHICPLGADLIFAADENGNVRKQTLAEYLQHTSPVEPPLAADRLDSPVTCSAIIPSELAVGGQFLLMGDEDGTVRVWDARSLHLRGSWTLFDDAVRTATLLDMEEADTLRGCVLLTSFKGSVAVLSLREMDELFLLPAARATLIRILIGKRDIMLSYKNGKARVWNVESREFRRSTGFDSAEDMLSGGGWADVPFRAPPPPACPVSKVASTVPAHSDLGRLLQLDIRDLGRWLHVQGGEGKLPALRGLLSVFLTFGINPAIDELCTSALGIRPPVRPVAIGLEGPHRTVEVAVTSPASAWRVSPTATGLRQLAIVSLLRPFLDSPEHESAAADVIAYYTACLPDNALEAELELFAAFYLDSSSDVHQAARMLFAARLSRISNDKIEELVADQQSHLPAVVSSELRMGEPAARALTMVGGMALHRFECMNPSALKSVAESISIYLNDPKSTHLALAIELCSKGFSTWQTYLDAMNLLRRLFYLATHKDANSVTFTNTAALARLAVLHVASSNAPLFMSTLSMDILDAKTVEGRTSIMKLCVFMARKRPALLENGLPRICEAVVKSLDPNAGKMRDDVWEAATVILNELVQAFTTIDFHAATQKLVVGTYEGAVIMYDLKTASRLYVLEAHKAPVSAVAFAPDGRRLVTVSMDDSNVTVWKIGSSLSAFFTVGGPPRQGGKPGEPYRRIPFVRPHKDPGEDTGALSDALILWRGNRQALVTIKETALNFETT